MSQYDSVYAVLQKPVSEHSRNVFPLEHAHSYSMKAGQITPIKCIHFKPADYFDIKAMDFSITFPMNTAPFLRGRKEFAFYSVYYNAVWSLFNQYQATRKDLKTSVFGNTPTITSEPRISLLQLYAQAFNQWLMFMYYDKLIPLVIGSDNPTNISIAQRNWLNGTYGGCFYTDSSWHPIYDNINNTNILDSVAAAHFLKDFDYLPSSRNRVIVFDVVGHWRAYSWIRKLDMLGYGNLYPLLRFAANNISQFVSDTDFSDTSAIAASLANCERVIMGVLVQLVNSCCRYAGTYANMTDPVFKMVNLYPICAYNSIFYHFFRNSYYDLDYKSQDYSLDFVTLNPVRDNEVYTSDFSMRFLDIEYHQWKKDKFTAVLPDQQFGAVSAVSLNWPSQFEIKGASASLNANNFDSVYQNTNGFILGEKSGSYSQFVIPTNNIASQFDVIALKRSEMLQQYRQQLMRAGNKTSDIFRALYGGAPRSEHSEDIIPHFMDTFGEDIFIDPVTSTADTGQGSQGNLGDLSARGKFSGQSGSIKFNAGHDFGCILCLAYIVPTAEYNSYMIDRHLQELTPEQHYIEQFENLGLEDIYSDELNSMTAQNGLQSLGKVPRYHQKKSEVDVVHGAFCSANLNISYGLLNVSGTFFGDFNHWVSPRTELQNRQSTSLRDFYINPNI